MIVLGIEARVSQESRNGYMLKSLFDRWFKVVTVGAWTFAYKSRCNQVAFVFTDDYQLCPSSVFAGSAALTLEKMPADIMIF